jgi:rubrerythrin
MTDLKLDTPRDVIAFAISREETSFRMYGRLAAIARIPGLTKTLLDLQTEEKRHQDLLEGLDPREIATLDVQGVEDIKLTDALLTEPLDEKMSFQDILIFAAKKEGAAADLYDGLAVRAGEAELKRLFEFLREQEKIHKRKLEIEYERFVLTEG